MPIARESQETNQLISTVRGPRAFIVLITIAVVLLASWLWAPTRASWDALDLLVFRSLNGTLALGSGWQHLWAFANSRIFDAISGLLLLALVFTSFREQRIGKLAIVSLGLAFLAIVVGRQIGTEFIVENWLHFERPSPTKVLDGCHRLSQLVPSIAAKDESPWSFPGDHGYIVLSLAIYMGFWSRRRITAATWMLAALLILPRLISGGHWMTDIIVGSMSMAMLTMAMLMGTGFHDIVVHRIGKRFGEIVDGEEMRESSHDELADAKTRVA